MARYKGDYNKESYCPKCEEWILEPTYRIMDLAVGIAPNPDIDKHPEIKIEKVWHDERGWKHTILSRLVLLHPKWTKLVYCSKGHMCRGKPHNKTDKRKAKDKRKTRQKNTIPDSVKIDLIDDTLRRLKTQEEYESDPNLRLDNPEVKHVGTIGTMMRGQIESTLEGVEKLRREFEVKRKRQKE